MNLPPLHAPSSARCPILGLAIRGRWTTIYTHCLVPPHMSHLHLRPHGECLLVIHDSEEQRASVEYCAMRSEWTSHPRCTERQRNPSSPVRRWRTGSCRDHYQLDLRVGCRTPRSRLSPLRRILSSTLWYAIFVLVKDGLVESGLRPQPKENQPTTPYVGTEEPVAI